MSCRQTEPGSGLDDGGGREAHNHNTDVPLQHLTAKRAAREKETVTQSQSFQCWNAGAEGLSMVTHTGLCCSKAVTPRFGASSAFFLEVEKPVHKSLFKIQSQGGPSQKVSVY